MFCVLCFVFTTERLSTSWSWPSLKTFSSSGYWWHPRTGGGAHGVHLNMAACNWCDTTNTVRTPHCLHCLCWNTQVCKPASATWREVLVHNSAKPCTASATKYETTFAENIHKVNSDKIWQHGSAEWRASRESFENMLQWSKERIDWVSIRYLDQHLMLLWSFQLQEYQLW